jgi:hypothetical protein
MKTIDEVLVLLVQQKCTTKDHYDITIKLIGSEQLIRIGTICQIGRMAFYSMIFIKPFPFD